MLALHPSRVQLEKLICNGQGSAAEDVGCGFALRHSSLGGRYPARAAYSEDTDGYRYSLTDNSVTSLILLSGLAFESINITFATSS